MSTEGYSVLLVEDDLPATDLAHRAAVDCCLEINLTVVGSGDAVLDWMSDSIAKNKQMPHIILMDMKLPKLDGLAVLRKLRMHAAMHDIPIVVFSTEYTQDDVLMSYQAGANSFVAKPADHAQFSELFREQLAYWTSSHQRKIPVAGIGDAAGLI
ncbi:MAG: hypothetical protein A3H31_12675 [Gallionellales bacterium RIFCSPLOWO2_02_FULL_57_47]|nr:MAG: hypothetical protein A3H31_12675 [Gallionellales bacterium RIFCSPLOWO2_02_FULL_57_47]OGT10055.1 MAG: hypothetical protein A3J49_16440 [Gallionellales bacterium RIFCSPHIGHO2_02_FULL_57_16]